MKSITYIAIAACAIVFALVAYLAARQSPLWARCAFLLIGVLGLGYGSLGYWLEAHRASLDYLVRASLDHYRTLVGGIAIGVFFVLLISGQIALAMKTRPKA